MGPAFEVVYLLWFLSELGLGLWLRSNSSDKKGADKNSFGLIWATIGFSIAIAVIVAQRISAPLYSAAGFSYIGLGLLITGILCRVLSIVSLGRMFTVDVTIRKDHSLKTDGVYKYIRHPSYLASLVSFLGFSIILNNWVSALIVMVPVTMAFIRRIMIEEAALTEAFGSAYTAYKQTTDALIPFVF